MRKQRSLFEAQEAPALPLTLPKTYARPSGYTCACCQAADLRGCVGPECRHHPEHDEDPTAPTDEQISAMAGETWEDYGRI